MGVGCYYNQVADVLEKQGHEILFFNHPTILKIEKTTFSKTLVPIFSGIRSHQFEKVFESFKPDIVHIQSEVGLGVSARHFCKKNAIPYSSAYHTNWDIGMKYWAHLPNSIVWTYLRWFYKPAAVIHACSERVKQLLNKKGINNSIITFPLGVDPTKFYYDPDPTLVSSYPRPYFMSMSRIAKEKNLEAFLKLDLPGTKFIIGNGPQKNYLQKKFHDKAVFLPYENVRQLLSMGDVFVFPSLYDTFGITNLEALACGLPIAAFPVMGPIDIIEPGISGYLSENLQEAALACLSLKKTDCMERASHFTWEKTAENFLKYQVLLN